MPNPLRYLPWGAGGVQAVLIASLLLSPRTRQKSYSITLTEPLVSVRPLRFCHGSIMAITA
jgi:hypothetical protein